MAYWGTPYDAVDRGEALCRCGQAACRAEHPWRVQVLCRGVVEADECFGSWTAAEAFVAWVQEGGAWPHAVLYTSRADLTQGWGEWHANPTDIRDRFIAAKFGAALDSPVEHAPKLSVEYVK